MIKNIVNETVLKGRTNNQCWFSPLMTVIPAKKENEMPIVHVHVTQQQGNDLGPMHILRTSNGGRTWSLPAESLRLDKKVLADDVFETPSLAPLYHRKTDKLIGYGNTVFSRDNSFNSAAKNEMLVHDMLPGRHNIFSVWDDEYGDWNGWANIELTDEVASRGYNLLVQACNQTVELDDGRIILPLVADSADIAGNRPLSAMCEFDGKKLTMMKLGNILGDADNKGRGFHEPSMIRFGEKFFMTIRSDREDFRMYCTESTDGINWNSIRTWCWDDGTEIETENTQQHWIKQGDKLYLVYTRVNEMSNGVFRSRAPLFIAEVDTDNLTLVRESEKIVFPANGGRMGNFTVANVSGNEVWVMTGEWIEQYAPGWKEGMLFYCQIESNGKMYNRNQYIGDMLLARILF